MSLLSSIVSELSGTSSTQPRTYLQCNGSKIQFPVPPREFDVEVNQNNQVININNIGDLNMLGKTGLLQLHFSSFFPAQDYYFCLCTPDDPYTYVKTIDAWRTSGKPARFSIAGTSVNYAVSIDKFTWGEHDGMGDVYFNIDFREYKFIGGAVDSTISDVTGLKARTDTSEVLETIESVTVYPGDSISDVVGRAVGKNISLGQDDQKVLNAYKALAKKGGLKTGSVVSYAQSSGILKVDGENV